MLLVHLFKRMQLLLKHVRCADISMNERSADCEREDDIPKGMKHLPFNRSVEFLSELWSFSTLAHFLPVVGGTLLDFSVLVLERKLFVLVSFVLSCAFVE